MEKHVTYSPSFDNCIYTSVTHNYPLGTQDYQDIGSIEQHLLWELVMGPDFRSAAGDAGKRLRTAEKGSRAGLDIIKKNSLQATLDCVECLRNSKGLATSSHTEKGPARERV